MVGRDGPNLPHARPPRAPQLFPSQLPQILRPANRVFPLSSSMLPVAPPLSESLADHPSSKVLQLDSRFTLADFGGKFSSRVDIGPGTKVFAASNSDADGDTSEHKIRAKDKETSNGEGLIDPWQKEVPPPPPVSFGAGNKRSRKQKSSKNKRNQISTPESIDGYIDASLSIGGCRYDSSLGLLTKKFISLLQQAEDGTLDLNKAADMLEVQKRRIYDITNVLEGIGLIEKKLKNRIRWKGFDRPRTKELEDQIVELRAHVKNLSSEEYNLDVNIRETSDNLQSLSEDENNKRWLYITRDDISSLPCFGNDTLIAIKAPHGTSLEVPNPDEGHDFPNKHYKIYLRSSVGPINCYLISFIDDNACGKLDSMTSHDPGQMCIAAHEDKTPIPPADEVTCTNSGADGKDLVDRIDHSDPLSSPEVFDGIVKILPSETDADYWLLSDLEGSITDMWTDYAS